MRIVLGYLRSVSSHFLQDFGKKASNPYLPSPMFGPFWAAGAAGILFSNPLKYAILEGRFFMFSWEK